MAFKLRFVPLSNTNDDPQGEIALGHGFSIRNIRGILAAECFRLWDSQISRDELNDILSWELCLVHEFSSQLVLGPDEQRSALLTRLVVASFRWIHPTESADYWFVCGLPSEQGAFTVHQFAHRHNLHIFLEDFEARMGLASPKVFLKAAPFLVEFERIVDSIVNRTFEFNPVVTALRLSEQAYLDFDPQSRFLKRMMALEALFSTRDNYGKRALIPRLPKFVGEDTLIYPGTGTSYSVGSVLADMCDLRNAFAHGDIVPGKFLDTPADSRVASTNVKSYADILREASAVVVRHVLVRIFQKRLVDVFADKKKMEALFQG